MEKPLILDFATYLRILDLCNENHTFLLTLDEYPFLKLELDNGILKVNAAKLINESNTKQFASMKDVYQKIMVDSVFELQRKGRLKARQIPDIELYKTLKRPISYMTQHDDDTVKVKAIEIKNIVKAKLSVLTNIQPSEVTAAETNITNYENYIQSPAEAIKARSTLGTNLIPILLKEMEPTREDFRDLFHIYLPDKAAQFDEAAKIGKPIGTRRLSIFIRFVLGPEKVPIRNILCTAVSGSTSHSKKSTKKGLTQFYSLENATWHLTFESEKYNTILRDVITNSQKAIRLEIPLTEKTPVAETPAPTVAPVTNPTPEQPTPEPIPTPTTTPTTPEPTPPTE